MKRGRKTSGIKTRVAGEENVGTASQEQVQTTKESTCLFELHRMHPDLPIIPLVTCQTVPRGYEAMQYPRWLGQIGRARLVSCATGKEGVYFREDYEPGDIDEIFEMLVDVLDETLEERPAPDQIMGFFNALPWQAAIAVDIDLPD